MSNYNNWSPAEEEEDHELRNRYRVNGRVMIAAIITLFFVVVLVVVLHIYARCVLRRRDRRRRAIIRQMSMGVAAAHTHTVQPPKTGLDPSVIAALPELVYRKTGQPNDPGVECTVCLSSLEEGEMARLLPNCNHTFHAQCIDMWLRSNSTCPICRTEAEPKPREEKVEASAPPFPLEGTSEAVGQSSKVGGSSSRMSSFRRMLSLGRERPASESRMHSSCGQDDHGIGDLERQ